METTIDDKLSAEHFPRICRLCLVSASEIHPHFKLVDRFVDNQSLLEIITSCLGLQIDPDDGLPSNICTACESILTVTHNFRNRCFRANKTLLELKSRQPVLPTVESAAAQDSKADGDSECLKHDQRFNYIAIGDQLGQTEIVQKEEEPDEQITEDEEDERDFEQTQSRDSDDEYDQDVADKYESLNERAPGNEAPSSLKTDPSDGTATSAVPHSSSASTTTPSSDRKRPAPSTDTSHSGKTKKSRIFLPTQCYVCGVLVKRIRNHMNTHPEEMKFECELCPRSYLTQTGRDRHRIAQHPETRNIIEPDGTVVPANRTFQKRLQKKLRYAGKQFVHRNGLLQSARQMRPGCDPQLCRFRCTERFAESLRQRAFDEYYALADLQKQWQYLALHCDRTVPKMPVRLRDGPRVPVRKTRQNNIKYFLYGDADEGHDKAAVAAAGDGESQRPREKIFICKTMFLATFDIGAGVVETALKKTDVKGNLIDGDRRGSRPAESAINST